MSSVAVALCTYEGRPWLESFLGGLVEQERPPDVLFVGDDGSRDGTIDLLREFARGAPFPVEITENPERLGATRNFEAVIARCEADRVALADQDDVWHPEKLARLSAALDAGPAGLVFSDADVIDESGRRTGRRLWEGVGFTDRERRRFDESPLPVLLRRSVVTGATAMFRADARDLVLPFPEALDRPANPMLHDRWIALVLAGHGSLAAVDDPLIDYRVHPAQQTGLRPPVGPGEAGRQLRRPRSVTCVELEARAAQFAALEARVEAGPAREAVGRARAHLERRAQLPDGRLRRLGGTTRELVTGRHHRWSRGWRSAVADVVRPAGK